MILRKKNTVPGKPGVKVSILHAISKSSDFDTSGT